jgi:hypothetical protein
MSQGAEEYVYTHDEHGIPGIMIHSSVRSDVSLLDFYDQSGSYPECDPRDSGGLDGDHDGDFSALYGTTDVQLRQTCGAILAEQGFVGLVSSTDVRLPKKLTS